MFTGLIPNTEPGRCRLRVPNANTDAFVSVYCNQQVVSDHGSGGVCGGPCLCADVAPGDHINADGFGSRRTGQDLSDRQSAAVDSHSGPVCRTTTDAGDSVSAGSAEGWLGGDGELVHCLTTEAAAAAMGGRFVFDLRVCPCPLLSF